MDAKRITEVVEANAEIADHILNRPCHSAVVGDHLVTLVNGIIAAFPIPDEDYHLPNPFEGEEWEEDVNWDCGLAALREGVEQGWFLNESVEVQAAISEHAEVPSFGDWFSQQLAELAEEGEEDEEDEEAPADDDEMPSISITMVVIGRRVADEQPEEENSLMAFLRRRLGR